MVIVAPLAAYLIATTPAPTANETSPSTGGTLYLLMPNDPASNNGMFANMDPTRIYTGEDDAFFGATITRSLTNYKYSGDPVQATTLVADAATDTGSPNSDATAWRFTLRNGMKWQDGSAVTCEDFKYGTSREFQQDVLPGGPTYAIKYLAIPADPNAANGSQYPGPYTATPDQQALFDQAVSCNGNTITFKLNQQVPDFNYTVTNGFSAVPNPNSHPFGSPCSDAHEGYDTAPCSDGPYMIGSFSGGVGGSMVLIRNPYWSRAVDDYRGAYPDRWEVDFAIDPDALDQRLIQATGKDAYALEYGSVSPHNLDTVFSDPHTAAPAFAGRAFSQVGPYSYYFWIRTDEIPLNLRRAMAVALNREQIRTAEGGAFVGDFADGVVDPLMGVDYAPTHLWDASGPFGEDVPPGGDMTLARKLAEQSSAQPGKITFDYLAGSAGVAAHWGDRMAPIVQKNFEDLGFSVTMNAISQDALSTMLDPDLQHQIGDMGWGADWANASTVIPLLFTDKGGFNLSRVRSSEYNPFYTGVAQALGNLDRSAQAQEWQQLDQTAADQVFAIPMFFLLEQRIAGLGVGNLSVLAPYGSWPYAQLYVKQ